MLDVVVIRRTGISVPSMDRYADAVQGSTVDPGLAIRSAAAPPGLQAGRTSQITGQISRWVGQPLSLRRCPGDVFHLVDHSDAHLLRVLPAERTVVSCHDLLLLRAAVGELAYSGKRWWATRFRWSTSNLWRAGAVLCPSEATRADVLRFCRVEPERVHLVPYGVGKHFAPLDPDARQAARNSIGAGARQVVLHVGSGAFYKNGAATFRVVANLLDRGLDVQLVRVGALPSEQERSLIVELGLQGRVIDRGQVSERQLVETYGLADVLLFPSTAEGFGWPALEAMACGLPVVTSSAPALIELVGVAGRRAGADDIRGLADQVSAVLTDSAESQRLRREGLARAREYGWERALTSYARIYHAVDDRARRGAPA